MDRAWRSCRPTRSATRSRKGTLVSCLGEFAPDDRGHYLCYLSRRQLPKRIRVFIDFMTSRIRALDLDCPLMGPGARLPAAKPALETEIGVAA